MRAVCCKGTDKIITLFNYDAGIVYYYYIHLSPPCYNSRPTIIVICVIIISSLLAINL